MNLSKDRVHFDDIFNTTVHSCAKVLVVETFSLVGSLLAMEVTALTVQAFLDLRC